MDLKYRLEKDLVGQEDLLVKVQVDLLVKVQVDHQAKDQVGKEDLLDKVLVVLEDHKVGVLVLLE